MIPWKEFPGRRGRRYSMYWAFFDDSGQWNADFAILAGFITDAKRLDRLDRSWRELLLKFERPYLHAKELRPADEHVRLEFIEPIRDVVMLGLGIGIDAKHFGQMSQKPDGGFGIEPKDAKVFLFQRLMRRLVDRMDGQSAMLYFDDSEADGPTFYREWSRLRRSYRGASEMFHTIAFADDRFIYPLQVADVIANETLRHLRRVEKGEALAETTRRMLLAPGEETAGIEYVSEMWNAEELNRALAEQRGVGRL